MNLKFTLLTGLLFLLFGGAAVAQADGDYQSNGTGGGSWTSNTTWQLRQGGAWVPAVTSPDATAGVITILNGDNVTLTSAITIDQVVVNATGTLTVTGGPLTITLNNNPANQAIDNFGQVILQTSATLIGTGTLLNESSGTLTVQGSSILAVNTTNGGTVILSGTVGVQSNTLTNNSVINWTDASLFLLSGGTILNNDAMNISVVGTASINGSGVLTNSSGAVITASAATTVSAGGTIAFTNSGSLEGSGTFDLLTATGSGSVTPGSPSAAVLSVGQAFLTAAIPNFNYNVTLYTAGAVAGTNYSQVNVVPGQLAAAAVDLSHSTLTVTDQVFSGDVDGVTTYTVMTATGGSTFNTATTFATANLPSTLGSLTVNANSVTVQRIFSLPLTWGPFTVNAEGNQAALAWSTLQESNVANFTIERSSDASTFTAIGTVKAIGNSHSPSSYSFTDASPLMQGYNYYRLTETDLDGKKAYSVIDVLSFGKTKTVLVQTSPNPVRDMLNITVQADNLSIMINSMNGTTMKAIKLNRGFQQASMSDLPAGAYNLIIYQGDSKIDSRQIIKF